LFKLIALDLDGTLLNRNKEISSENLEVINKVIDKGYEVVIATGRGYYLAKGLINSIKRPMTILANNGNILRSSKDDKVIFSKFINKADFKNVLLLGKSYDLHPIIHVDYYLDKIDMIIEDDYSQAKYKAYLTKNDNRFKKISDDSIYDIDRALAIVYPGKKAMLNEFSLEINKRFPNRYNSHLLEKIDMAEAMFEVMNPQGSKWKSIVEYSNSKGIRPEEIIAFGDDNNDIEMIVNSGLGVAMKNGSSLIKEVADIISERDNENSGVAFELKKILNI
jgi:hypothetical protein